MIVVQFKADATSAEIAKVVSDFGLSMKNAANSSDVVCVVGVPVGSEKEWIAKFKKLACVKHAEPIIEHKPIRGEF